MLMRNILILSVLFFCFSCKKERTESTDPKNDPVNVAAVQTYYVDGAAGNDSNNGLTDRKSVV